MKKLFLLCMAVALLVGVFMVPTSKGIASIASRYPFKAGDMACIRKSASFYTCKNGNWAPADVRPAQVTGIIKSIKTVTLPIPDKLEVSYPRAVKLYFPSGGNSITLYEIAGCVNAKSLWVDDIAPAISYGNQTVIFDAYKGEIHVNLKTSSFRKTVLHHGLEIAKALRQEHKNLGYEEYFKVDIEYFAWELIAHAYAAEYGLPGYWDSSIADCSVSETDAVTQAMIELARMFWKEGPEKKW